MKIRIFFVSVLITTSVLFINADSYWEGAASMSRYGEFPVNGYYGASNSFPINSIVEVSNPAENKKIEVIIVNKLDDNNLFILLSKDAAAKLSIKEDSLVTVKARIVKKFEDDKSSEKILSDDPDFNPSTAVLLTDPDEKEEPLIKEKDSEDIPEEKAEYERDLRDEIIETLIISDIPRKYEEDDAEDKGAEEEAEEEDIEITAIIVPDEEEDALEAIEKVPEEAAAEEELFEKYDPETVVIAETEEKEALDSEESELVPSGEFEEKLVLVPSGPKPPENGVEAESVNPEEISDKAVIPELAGEIFKEYSSADKPAETLDNNSYYLQIGAFRDFKSADHLASDLNLDYPVFLYKKGENSIYRVMAGPLKNDEKGAALYQVRIKGIKDAFIRKGE